MVKYYGRAKTRVGAVNTNQLGLKMSGCPSKIGKQGALVKYQSRRVQCNQKFCGPVYYQGQMWSWNSERCVPRAPRTQTFNSGVGHINAPRFGCSTSCSVDESSLVNAIKIINEYFSPYFMLVFMGNKEYYKFDLDLYNHLNLNLIDIADKSKVDKYPPKIKQALHLVSIHSRKGNVNGKKVKFTPVLIDLIAYHYMYSTNQCVLLGQNDFPDEIKNSCDNNANAYPTKLKDNTTQNQYMIYFEPGTLHSAVFFYLLYHALFHNNITYNLVTVTWLIIKDKYGDISEWDVRNIKSMKKLFYFPKNDSTLEMYINRETVSKWIRVYLQITPTSIGDITNWNTSNVTDMSYMFMDLPYFNQPIGNWDTSNVTDMSYMFSGASEFNQPLGNWVTSNVTDMSHMFYEASTFDQPLDPKPNGIWNTNNVKNMCAMFYNASKMAQILRWSGKLNNLKIANCFSHGSILDPIIYIPDEINRLDPKYRCTIPGGPPC